MLVEELLINTVPFATAFKVVLRGDVSHVFTSANLFNFSCALLNEVVGLGFDAFSDETQSFTCSFKALTSPKVFCSAQSVTLCWEG